MWACERRAARHARPLAELQIVLSLCPSCPTVMILQVYGRLIAQYTSLSKIGCSKAFLNSPASTSG